MEIRYYDTNFKNKTIVVPFVDDSQIEQMTSNLLIEGMVPEINTTLDFLLKKTHDLSDCVLDFSGVPSNTYYSCVNIQTKTITIPSFGNEMISRYTVTRTLGHIILHYQLLKEAGVYEIVEDQSSLWASNFIDTKDNRLGYQANMFAMDILLPTNIFVSNYKAIHKDMGIRLFPRLYLDNQPCNIWTCRTMFNKLARFFNVPAGLIIEKLKKLGYLTVSREPQLIGSIINNMRECL
jgi:Zn-dependent peptidase ImmA (M78 family)